MAGIDGRVLEALREAFNDPPGSERVWPVVARGDFADVDTVVVARVSQEWRAGGSVLQAALTSYRVEARGADWEAAGATLDSAVAALCSAPGVSVVAVAGGTDDFDGAAGPLPAFRDSDDSGRLSRPQSSFGAHSRSQHSRTMRRSGSGCRRLANWRAACGDVKARASG